jgi:hypothetical protein
MEQSIEPQSDTGFKTQLLSNIYAEPEIQPTPTVLRKLYSPEHAVFVTVIGGPLAAIYSNSMTH